MVEYDVSKGRILVTRCGVSEPHITRGGWSKHSHVGRYKRVTTLADTYE